MLKTDECKITCNKYQSCKIVSIEVVINLNVCQYVNLH